MNLKVPPQSEDAEVSVLGGLMLVKDAWEKVADLINEEDFYRHDHQLIFKSIKALNVENKPCDLITVTEWLKTHQIIEEAGGEIYLTELATSVPGAANIKAYAEIVREKSVLRQLVQIGNNQSRDLGLMLSHHFFSLVRIDVVFSADILAD